MEARALASGALWGAVGGAASAGPWLDGDIGHGTPGPGPQTLPPCCLGCDVRYSGTRLGRHEDEVTQLWLRSMAQQSDSATLHSCDCPHSRRTAPSHQAQKGEATLCAGSQGHKDRTACGFSL